MLPILLDFLDLHPAVQVRLLLLDRVTSLVDEAIDVAIRIAHLPSSGLTARRVGFHPASCLRLTRLFRPAR